MNTKEYKYIEYTDDNDFVIANVVMDEDKIVSVKLTEACLTNKTEYIELLQFLDEIKTMPWKYDDTEQERVGWYNVHSENFGLKLRPVQISSKFKTVEQLGYLPTCTGDEIHE